MCVPKIQKSLMGLEQHATWGWENYYGIVIFGVTNPLKSCPDPKARAVQLIKIQFRCRPPAIMKIQ